MRARAAGLAALLMVTSLLSTSSVTRAFADEDGTVTLEDVVRAEQAKEAALAAPTPAPEVATPAPATVPIASPFVDYAAALQFYRTLPPQVLLLHELKSQVAFDRLAPKIQRESHWTCGENNPRSTAAGLGQTLYNKSRENFLAARGFTWAEVRGPDCLADVILIAELYRTCGLGPWTAGWKCQKPVY